MSKRYLLYAEEGLEHRFVVVPEWATDRRRRRDRRGAADAALRGAARARHRRHARAPVASRGVSRRTGPTGLLMTTTAPVHRPGTRDALPLVPARRLAASRPAASSSIVADLEDDDAAPVDYDRWHALQRWLADHGENRVVIPYVRELAQLMPTVATRLRRDFVSVLCLVRAHAMLHQATRERDERGRIVATVADYAAVHELLDDLVAEAVDASVSPATRDTVEAVRELLEARRRAHVRQADRGPPRGRSLGDLRPRPPRALRRVPRQHLEGERTRAEDRARRRPPCRRQVPARPGRSRPVVSG